MLRLIVFLVFFQASSLLAQESPASPSLMTMGPIDGESDQKATIITIRYDAKPGFAKPKVEAMGSFLQVTLPATIVPKPGQFIEANSPYIRKFAAFQLDEQTAGLRLFVTKEASHLLGAVTTDILENRVVIVLDHVEAEKQLLAHFDGVPVEGGPSPEEIVKKTEVRTDIPDPVKPHAVVKDAAPKVEAADQGTPAWTDGLKDKLIIATAFSVVMLLLLIGMKTWRRMMTKKWPGALVEDYSLKTLATHSVGPKQKVTVIQVGNEQILLGVSPDSINFLTSIKKAGEPPKVAIDPSMYQRPAMLPKEPLRSDTSMKQRPKVLEESTPRPSTKQRPNTRNELPEPGSAISYGISDQGIKNMKTANSGRQADEGSSVDDVTRMIRKKLRDLPKV